MQTGLIGVIVPVYKTEKYIAECIESILAQTYTKFRLVLVDDGSPDSAGTICDQYAAKDNRITVIHQENAGVTRARAQGVEEASNCEWIAFVDSDDTIKKDTLQVLIENANNNYDIIISSFRKYSKVREGIITVKHYLQFLFSENNISLGPCGKLYRRTLFDRHTFDIPRDIVIGEDLIMNIHLALYTDKCVKIISDELYNYREYAESTFHSHKRTPKNEQDIHLNKIKTLPKDLKDECIKSTIQTRFLRAKEFWGYKYSVEDMKKSEFYTSLRSDIKKYKFNIPFIDRIIFNNSNFIIRFLAINTKKIINKIYQ